MVHLAGALIIRGGMKAVKDGSMTIVQILNNMSMEKVPVLHVAGVTLIGYMLVVSVEYVEVQQLNRAEGFAKIVLNSLEPTIITLNARLRLANLTNTSKKMGPVRGVKITKFKMSPMARHVYSRYV